MAFPPAKEQREIGNTNTHTHTTEPRQYPLERCTQAEPGRGLVPRLRSAKGRKPKLNALCDPEPEQCEATNSKCRSSYAPTPSGIKICASISPVLVSGWFALSVQTACGTFSEQYAYLDGFVVSRSVHVVQHSGAVLGSGRNLASCASDQTIGTLPR